MKRTDPKSIAEVMGEALEMTGMTESFNEQRLCSLWPDIVGPHINRLTTRRFVDSGTFHVYMTSAALKNELQFNRQQLIDALNRAVGAVVITDIKFH